MKTSDEQQTQKPSKERMHAFEWGVFICDGIQSAFPISEWTAEAQRLGELFRRLAEARRAEGSEHDAIIFFALSRVLKGRLR